MRKLTIQEQIIVLHNAKNEINYQHGLCGAIRHSLYCDFQIDAFFTNISVFIKNFSFENIHQLCELNSIEPPKKDVYWWDVSDKNLRLEVLDLLIEQLKNQLK